jgi:hypothetical protein
VEPRHEQLEALCSRVFGIGGKTLGQEIVVGELTLDPSAKPPDHKMVRLLAGSRNFKDTYNYSRKELDSASQYDLALANMTVDDGWTDQEIADLIIHFRARHGRNPEKALRQDYIEGLIRKARDRSELLDKLPFNLKQVIQFGVDDAEYRLVIDRDGQDVIVPVGTNEVLLSFSRSRGKLFDAGFILPDSLRRQWTSVVAAMRSIVVVEEMPTELESWHEFILAEVQRGPVGLIDQDDPDCPSTLREALQDANPFVHLVDSKGRLYVRAEALLRPAQLTMGQGITKRTIGLKLRQLGFEKLESVDVPGQAKRRRLNLWESPEGFAWEAVQERREVLAELTKVKRSHR